MRHSNVYLVVLLETEKLSPLAETPSANVETVLADNTTAPLANSATPFVGTLSVRAWMRWNEVNWHQFKGQIQPL